VDCSASVKEEGGGEASGPLKRADKNLGLFEVTTKRQLGVTEVTVINSLIDALATLVIAEQQLETTGEDILEQEVLSQDVDAASERTASLVRGGSSEVEEHDISPTDTWKAAGEALEHLFLATVESCAALDDHEDDHASVCVESPIAIQGQLAEELLAAVEDAALADLIVGKTEDLAGEAAGDQQQQQRNSEPPEGGGQAAATLESELTRVPPSEPELIEATDEVVPEKTAWPQSEATELPPAASAPPPEDAASQFESLRNEMRDAFVVASLDGSLENILRGIAPGAEAVAASALLEPPGSLLEEAEVTRPLVERMANLLEAAAKDGSLAAALVQFAQATPVAPSEAVTPAIAPEQDRAKLDVLPDSKVQAPRTTDSTMLTARSLLLTMAASARRLGSLTSKLQVLEEAIAARDAEAAHLKTQIDTVRNENDHLGGELTKARHLVAEQEIKSFKLQGSLWTGRSGASTACTLQDANENAKTLPFPKQGVEADSRPLLEGSA